MQNILRKITNKDDLKLIWGVVKGILVGAVSCLASSDKYVEAALIVILVSLLVGLVKCLPEIFTKDSPHILYTIRQWTLFPAEFTAISIAAYFLAESIIHRKLIFLPGTFICFGIAAAAKAFSQKVSRSEKCTQNAYQADEN
ncbi:hypothetical protein LJB93_02765 [Desulfovibrio sp. OttesenSCG-928-F07]|nr:hypothetical protein [Desulfovibrio sp. OttesenSCG-928-F07]